MSDRDLLEKAAKAAGVVIDKSHTGGGGYFNDGFDVMGNAVLDWHSGKKWNPLTDDGDALRLAVKLDFTVIINRVDEKTTVEAGYSPSMDGRRFFTEHYDGRDHYAATRRAIVRAAAAIGEKA